MTKQIKTNLSDELRNHIKQKLSENYDYSTNSNKKLDVQNFIAKFPELKLNFEKVRKIHWNILPSVLKSKGINPATVGLQIKKKRPVFTGSSSFESTIQPRPQGNPNLNKNGEQLKEENQANNNSRNLVNPINNNANQQLEPQKIILNNFNVESVSATINGLYLTMKSLFPELEFLSDEEKKNLGVMWQGAFNRYLTENWALIGMPLFGTLGIVFPKLVRARKDKKEKLLKKLPDNLDSTKEEKRKDKTEKEPQLEKIDMTKSGDAFFDE